MSSHVVWQLAFEFLPHKPICVEPVAENLSSDAGLLIFRHWDEQGGVDRGLCVTA